MSFRVRLQQLQANRRCSSKIKSSFDVDLVSKNYEQRMEWAAANFGNKGAVLNMVLPPPNVTGKLHIGHALTATIEDTICRYHRIKGGVAHWLPGFDHAGIATQSVAEKELLREKGIHRYQMPREDFIQYCQHISERNSTVIREQLKRMGTTLDWSKQYYTLDPKFSAAVTRAFCELHSDKLIFRDKRIVQWCPTLRSSISDQEVERITVAPDTVMQIVDRNGNKIEAHVGNMHVVKYKLVGEERFLEVGTTRPETLFADVALAVHPKDDRYAMLIGKLVEHPLIPGYHIPVVADEAVQIDKGTGVVKITPSHDSLDYEIASRNWNNILNVNPDAKTRSCLDDAGHLVNAGQGFDGLNRFEARTKVIDKLSSLQRYSGCGKFDSAQISVCSRTGDIIEPRLTDQWFLETKSMHAEVEKALRDGRIKITPSYHEQMLFDWLSNTDPWCLSRQLVWGHQIPAYRTENSDWVVASSLEEAQRLLNANDVQRDSDVLDTWFSSALVPLVTSGWMDGTMDLSKPPLNVMETGWDILGFWAVRMMMLTMKLTNGQIPFPQVVLHGLVRDSTGRKMSKSLGNVIDPLDILDGISQENMLERLENSSLSQKEKEAGKQEIQTRNPTGIPKYGADALRFALLRHDMLSTDIPININYLAGEGSRFCNKLWNLVIYVESVNEKCETKKDVDSDNALDLWIVSQFATCIQQVDAHMAGQSPHLAFGVLHKFILSSLCDVYLEATKKAVWNQDEKRLDEIQSTLRRVLQPTLVQLSVFMPFVSEFLYEKVFQREKGAIYFDFVKPFFYGPLVDEELDEKMSLALQMVSAVRSVRQQLQLPLNMPFDGILYTSSEGMDQVKTVLSDLVDLNLVEIRKPNDPVPTGFMPSNVPGSSDRLAVRIENSYKSEFIGRIERLLKKTMERRDLFKSKWTKYEEIVARDSADPKIKPAIVQKSQRKADQAKNVTLSAQEEVSRLSSLLEELKMDQEKKSEAV